MDLFLEGEMNLRLNSFFGLGMNDIFGYKMMKVGFIIGQQVLFGYLWILVKYVQELQLFTRQSSVNAIFGHKGFIASSADDYIGWFSRYKCPMHLIWVIWLFWTFPQRMLCTNIFCTIIWFNICSTSNNYGELLSIPH